MKVKVLVKLLLFCMVLGNVYVISGCDTTYYVRTEFNKKDTQMGVFDSLEKAKKIADDNAVYGYRVYNSRGKIVYTTYTRLVSDILRESKYITDYVRENDFYYGNAPINPAIDHSACLVSCDRFVNWVMYNLGYTDQPYESGLFVYSTDERDIVKWCEKYNFKKITKESDLRAGDIVFVNPKKTSSGITYPGHTFIHAGKSRDGQYYRYDCGSDIRIQSVQPSSEAMINFMYAYRPVKKK